MVCLKLMNGADKHHPCCLANFAPQPANRETRFLPGKEQQKPELRVLLGHRLTGERGKRRLRRFQRPSTSIQSGRGAP